MLLILEIIFTTETLPSPRLAFIWKAIGKVRQWVAAFRYYSRIIRPCTLNLILAAGIPLLFILVLQAMELLRCMAENEFSFEKPYTWQRIFFLLSLATFSLHAWYFSRVLLYVRYPDSPELTVLACRVRSFLPRFAGVVPCLIMARAAWRSAGLYEPDDPGRFELRLSTVAFVVTAIVLYAFFRVRRRVNA